MDESVCESQAACHDVLVCFILVGLQILCSRLFVLRNSLVGINSNLERLFAPGNSVYRMEVTGRAFVISNQVCCSLPESVETVIS